jgi:diadenosine tetraphosphatase ApaH/serine/threonine PP2A family protein phosphatase
MRLAVFSDIHGNAEALEACLDHASEMGVDGYAVIGDLVGYGPDPERVIDTVADLSARGAIVVKGNHDEAIERGTDQMNGVAAEAIRWTRAQLDPSQKAFLAQLPLTLMRDDVMFVHASAARPETWPYIDSPAAAIACFVASGARLTLCGHTHVPHLFHQLPGQPVEDFIPVPNRRIPLSSARRYLGVLGAVGQPRDRDPRACWGLLESDGLTFCRVGYDVEETQRKIKAAGLPEWLGDRLELGR